LVKLHKPINKCSNTKANVDVFFEAGKFLSFLYEKEAKYDKKNEAFLDGMLFVFYFS